MTAKKSPDRPSDDDADAGTPAKPVLDSVIDAVSALSELARSLRARARENAEKEAAKRKSAKSGKKSAPAKGEKGAKKSDSDGEKKGDAESCETDEESSDT